MEKAFNHLMVKYSQDKNEIFSKPNAKRKMINTLSLYKPEKTIASAWDILDMGRADRKKLVNE